MKEKENATGTKRMGKKANPILGLFQHLSQYLEEGKKRLNGNSLSAEALEALDILHGLFHAFYWIADDAMNIEKGGRARLDLTPKGKLARLERRAEAFAKVDPHFPQGVPNPCTELSRMRKLLRLLDIAAEKRERGDYSDEEKELLNREAVAVASKCFILRYVVRVRGEAIFEREGLAIAALIELASAKEREEKAKEALFIAQNKPHAAKQAKEKADGAAAQKVKWEGEWKQLFARLERIEASQEKATAAAAGAERAALRAEAAAERKAKVDGLDENFVETFKEFDAALKDEAGTQLEIARDVLKEAREPKDKGGKGRLLGSCGTRKFLELWRGWGKRGRPDAAQYAAIHEKEGRRPV